MNPDSPTRPAVFVHLHAPADFVNLCVIARTLECFGIQSCSVFDPCALVRTRYGKSYRQRLRTVSAGAFHQVAWTRTESTAAALAAHAGRTIALVAPAPMTATTPPPTATPSATAPPPAHRATGDIADLWRFSFLPDDLLVFGSEAQGLPPEVAARCDARVTIPTVGRTQSLNLSVCVGIVVAEACRQLHAR